MSYLENILSSGQNPSFIPPGSGMRTRGDHIVLDAIYGGGSDLATQLNTVHGPAFASMPSAGQEKMDTPAGPIWEKRIKDLGNYPIHGTKKAQDKWKLDAKLSDEERTGLQQLVKQTLTLEFEALYKQGDYEEASKIAKKLSEVESKPKYERHDPYKAKEGFYDGGGAQGQPTDKTHPLYGKGLKGGNLERVLDEVHPGRKGQRESDEKSFWDMDFKDIPAKLGISYEGSNLQDRLGAAGKEYKDLWAGQWGLAKQAGTGIYEGARDMQGPFDSETDIQGPFDSKVDIQGPFDEDITYPPLSDFGKGSDIGPALDDLGRVASDAQIGADELIRNVTGSVMEGSVDLARLATKPVAGVTSGLGALATGANWDKMYKQHGEWLGDAVELPMRVWQKQPEYLYNDPLNLPTLGLRGVLKEGGWEETWTEAKDIWDEEGGLSGSRPYGTEKDALDKLKRMGKELPKEIKKLEGSGEDEAALANLRKLSTRVSLEILQESGLKLPKPGKDGKIFVDAYNSTNDTWEQVQVDTESGLTQFVESINTMNPDGTSIRLTGPGETASAEDISKLVESGKIRVTKDGVTTAPGSLVNDPSAPPALKNAAREAEQAYSSADPNTRGEPMDFFAKMLSQTMGDISDIREKLVQTDRQIKEVLGRTPHWLEVVATLLVEAYAASMGQAGVGTAMLKQYTEGKRQQISDIQKQQTTLMQLMGQYQRSAVDLYTQAGAESRAGYKTAQEMVKEDKLTSKPYIEAHKDLDKQIDDVLNDAKSYDLIDLKKAHIDFTGQKDAPMTEARVQRYEYTKYIKQRATLEARRIFTEQKILAFMQSKKNRMGMTQELTPGMRINAKQASEAIALVNWYASHLEYKYKGKKAPLDEPSAMPKYYDWKAPVPGKEADGKILKENAYIRANGLRGLIQAQDALESIAQHSGMATRGIVQAIALSRKLVRSYYHRKR